MGHRRTRRPLPPHVALAAALLAALSCHGAQELDAAGNCLVAKEVFVAPTAPFCDGLTWVYENYAALGGGTRSLCEGGLVVSNCSPNRVTAEYLDEQGRLHACTYAAGEFVGATLRDHGTAHCGGRGLLRTAEPFEPCTDPLAAPVCDRPYADAAPSGR
jgi:hypothetical protein